jgi:cytidylate kinase-like protein
VRRKLVCISHAEGAAGEQVGRLVAERLGFVYVDEEIVARAAARGGIDPADVADEERRKSLLERVLVGLAQGGPEAWAGFVPPGVGGEKASDDIRAFILEVIEQTAARGRAVIVAHAASYAVRPGTDALRVLVTASPDTRGARLVSAKGLDQDEGARAVNNSDAGRADYLKRFYGISEELPTHYDLVVNTDAVSVEQAAGLISLAASE